MTDNEKIKELLEASSDGVITAEQVTAAGLHRSVLQALVEKGEIYRFGRGLYALCNTWEDDFYLLQRKYGRGIYSHETALLFHDLTDREPDKYSVTVKTGYNPSKLKKDGMQVHCIKRELYDLGKTTMETTFGNEVPVYDMERTVCDVIRNRSNIEMQVF